MRLVLKALALIGRFCPLLLIRRRCPVTARLAVAAKSLRVVIPVLVLLIWRISILRVSA